MRSWAAFLAGVAFATTATYLVMRRDVGAPRPSQATLIPEPASLQIPEAPEAPAEEPPPAVRVSQPRTASPRSWKPPRAPEPVPPQPVASLPEPPSLPFETVEVSNQPPVWAFDSPAPLPPPEPNRVTLLPGTLITVRLNERLSSGRHGPGDAFSASLDEPLIVDGFVIAERGAPAEGKVSAVSPAGRVRGAAALAIELVSVRTSDGQRVEITTDPFERKAPTTKGADAAKVGVSAALGAAIGAIAAGGKGAAIGAGAGSAAGAGAVLAGRGQPAELAAETRISFRLNRAVTIVESR
jgi:hypothetical protein